MTVKGIDIAWVRPTVSEIKAVGAHFVMRYFSTDPKKNLTAADVTNYKAGGLETGVVWETTAGRATAGKAAGIADAQAAEVQRKAVGLPSDMVIHFAVDLDTSWASVQSYFDGVISVLGIKRVGAYGGVRIIDGAYGHGIRYLWQTIAWSGGVQSPHATLYQHGGTTLSGGADWDTALATDYGQYPRPAAPQPPQEDPLSAFTPQSLHDAVWKIDDIAAGSTEKDPKNTTWQPQSYLKGTYENTVKIAASEAAQTAAITALATALGKVDAAIDVPALVAQVKAAIATGVNDALASVNIHLTTS